MDMTQAERDSLAAAYPAGDEYVARAAGVGSGGGMDSPSRASEVKLAMRVYDAMNTGRKHFRAADLRIIALHAAGFKVYEVANMVGMSTSAVSDILNDPALAEARQALVDQILQDTLHGARQILQGYTAEAALTLVKHMRSEKESISLKATESILDRTGIPKAEVVQQSGLLLQKEEYASLREALDAMQTPDVPYQEVEVTHSAITSARQRADADGSS